MSTRTRLPAVFLLSALAWLTPASGTGIMLPKGPDIPALAIKSHRVKVVIADQVARTQVEQVFLNNTDQQLEATFIFPLPAGASVSEFAMMMNGKRVVGELLEKDRARGIYTDIVRRMKDPALLEYAGSNLFKASVFPIPPRGEQKIDLSYSEVVKLESGLAEYVFPLKTGEKYSRTMDDFSVSVELESKIPLKSVYSPTHTVEVVRKSDTKALVSCEEPRGALDRDFRLLYALSDKDFGLNLLTHRPKDQDGYFLMMIAPKADVKEAEILPKDVCFVIDTSGSMSGEKMEQARKALEYCVNSLGDKDRFNIIRFSTDVEVFSETLKPAGKSARKEAADFIAKLAARGGTDISFALEKALTLKTDGKRPYLVVFLTDGRPTIGRVEPVEILDNLRKNNQTNTRIFVFGVGLEVNTHLLDQIADQTRATTQYVAPDEDIEVKVSALYDRVSAPVLANLKVELGDIGAFDMYPKQFPDLFKGTQLLVFGRFKRDGKVAIKLTGTLGKADQAFVYEDSFPQTETRNDFIPKLWASRKVGYLLDEIRLRGENDELVKEVIALSKEHGIMTPYTSYLVAEDTPVRAAGAGGRIPPPLQPGPILEPMAQVEEGKLRAEGELDVSGKIVLQAGQTVITLNGNADEKDPPSDSARAKAETGRVGRNGGVTTSGSLGGPAEIESLGSLRPDTGVAGVKASEVLRDLKDKQTLGGRTASAAGSAVSGPAVATLGDRKFKLVKDLWIDSAWKPENQPMKVKCISDAYFKLLDRDPTLDKVFALGEKVLVVLKSGKAVLVGEEGKEDLSDKELDELFGK